MNNNPDRSRPTADRNAPVVRHIIVCAVALCIISAGVWSLMNDAAPYHPAEYSDIATFEADEVSRDGAVLISVSAGD